MDQQVQGQGQNPVLERLAFSAKNMSVWLKVVGIINIISGALTAISLVGIIIAWAPIWMGILLYQASSRADEARASGRYDQLVTMMEKLRLYFLIQGILIIVMVVLSVIGFLIFGAGIIAMLNQGTSY
ncbi:MAG: DUF5362 family protein [Calditrichaceae bacterium]|jgi:hypothetical protein